MTNAEAIEVMERIARWQATKLETTDSIEAMDMAIAALREKADKERRYVVTERYVPSATRVVHRFCVYDIETESMPAYDIPTREAAQSIADIYEGGKQ